MTKKNKITISILLLLGCLMFAIPAAYSWFSDKSVSNPMTVQAVELNNKISFTYNDTVRVKEIKDDVKKLSLKFLNSSGTDVKATYTITCDDALTDVIDASNLNGSMKVSSMNSAGIDIPVNTDKLKDGKIYVHISYVSVDAEGNETGLSDTKDAFIWFDTTGKNINVNGGN